MAARRRGRLFTKVVDGADVGMIQDNLILRGLGVRHAQNPIGFARRCQRDRKVLHFSSGLMPWRLPDMLYVPGVYAGTSTGNGGV